MKWIKANEILPEHEDFYHVKVQHKDEFVVNMVAERIISEEEDTVWSVNSKDLKVIEWLDESDPSFMQNEIRLLKNNDKRTDSDLEWVEEFYRFLQGNIPDGIKIRKPIKLSPKQAFSIIWYLQEHFPLFPDRIERCHNCNDLFDSYSEGLYWETKARHYCGGCEYLVPDNYDRGKK